ncbi:16S rRNA (uracil(1498)-N(3))-methyltransferase [Methyloferula stellata]|uniref:16S rRNA (uracil(1498)-N(3))-methyltransferase n=1 Tax=Methyloferula stellata TaxID=876270 RepID=UPI0003694670|nr:16S rRNA (uracil(1498)-N(3))-methyltransferase [Methyloferula stellata]
MARYDFSAHRLYVETALAPGASVPLDRAQANYLGNVLRLPDGAELLIFNGQDGEWRAALASSSRKSMSLTALTMVRPQEAPCDLHYLFAPLKHARLDYMVQKAVEMGASLLRPVQTQHTQATRLNAERMRANVIEAAEQCGILAVPEVAPLASIDTLLDGWPQGRSLIFCDEDAPIRDPIEALHAAQKAEGSSLALLIGPEGGFDAREREKLLSLPQTIRLSLGPRILRADTAGVAAMALVQAALGDWRG